MSRALRLAALRVRLAEARGAAAEVACARARRHVAQGDRLVAAFAPTVGPATASTLIARDGFARRLSDGRAGLELYLARAAALVESAAIAQRRAERGQERAVEAQRAAIKRAAKAVRK